MYIVYIVYIVYTYRLQSGAKRTASIPLSSSRFRRKRACSQPLKRRRAVQSPITGLPSAKALPCTRSSSMKRVKRGSSRSVSSFVFDPFTLSLPLPLLLPPSPSTSIRLPLPPPPRGEMRPLLALKLRGTPLSLLFPMERSLAPNPCMAGKGAYRIGKPPWPPPTGCGGGGRCPPCI